MSDRINQRKIEHINIVKKDQRIDRQKHYFDRIHLKHRALPEIDLQSVDSSVEFMGKKLSFPLLISSMTGGNHEVLQKMNTNLAIAAEETSVAMGVGSQRVMFSQKNSIPSFSMRKYAPSTLLFSNLGAVQLNYGFSVDHCRKAVDVVGADAICLHLNPLQEAIQPEGNTNFSHLGEKIGIIIDQLDYPVIIKEVGSGVTPNDIDVLLRYGVKYVDVAGSGGTSWSRIEYFRQPSRENPDTLGVVFQDWGIPTPVALSLLRSYTDRVTLIGSGGLRNGIDMIKTMILGASLCGLASPFVKPALESPEAVIAIIKRLQREFTTAMFLLGTRNIHELIGKTSLIINPTGGFDSLNLG